MCKYLELLTFLSGIVTRNPFQKPNDFGTMKPEVLNIDFWPKKKIHYPCSTLIPVIHFCGRSLFQDK